jgi:glutathione S-transferase
MARYGPTPLAPDPHDPAFPLYQQFLHLGEAGLAASNYFVYGARYLAPEAERQNWSARQARGVFESRLRLVTRQLSRSHYLAGEVFTAADISVTYALEQAQRQRTFALGDAEQAYVARTSGRDAYKRAMQTCHDTRAWAPSPTLLRCFRRGVHEWPLSERHQPGLNDRCGPMSKKPSAWLLGER